MGKKVAASINKVTGKDDYKVGLSLLVQLPLHILAIKSSQVNTLPKAKSKTRSKHLKRVSIITVRA